jgi:hypothetical protein
MKQCHYQDEPGRKCICLRARSERAAWRTCDDHRNSSCPHRGWDRSHRDDILTDRLSQLGTCCTCGKCHDTVRQMLECEMAQHLEHIFDHIPGPAVKGSDDLLVPGHFPRFLKEKAWRLVRKAVLERDHGRCQECDRDLKGLPSWYGEVHHIKPRIEGGGDHPRNLITLCIECHGHYTDDLRQGSLKCDPGINTHTNGRKGKISQTKLV